MGSRLIFHFNLAQSKSTSAILSHDGTIPKDIVQRSIHAHCSAKMFCCLCSFIHYLFLAYDLSIRIRCYLKILNQRIVCHWMFCYVIIYIFLLQRNYFRNFHSIFSHLANSWIQSIWRFNMGTYFIQDSALISNSNSFTF